MSLQGPLILITESPADGSARAPAQDVAQALGQAGAFPIVEAPFREAIAALTSIQPAAVVIDELGKLDTRSAALFAHEIKRAQPLIPVIARVQENDDLPYAGALAISSDLQLDRLTARLASALRVRSLHATVLRRLESLAAEQMKAPVLAATDPLEDATVLVLGRGRSYPILSVAVGEQVGVFGALSVEAAGKCLAAREIDGIIVGDGFGQRILEAFLFVLNDDARFRDLPVGVLGDGMIPPKMPNVLRERDPLRLVERMLPFVRMHALDARLKRMLQSLECQGLLDPETGLLHTRAFGQDLTRAVDEANIRGDGLTVARFSFNTPVDRRASLDAARVVSRLMRTVDFACRQDDGSILTVFTGTDLRAAHVAARRLASVLKQTMLRPEHQPPLTPNVTLATLKSADTVITLMARVSTVAAG